MDRNQTANSIADNPDPYKVCEGCESIVLKKANLCPICHGYRFDESASRVSEQATLLGSRPPTSVKPQDLV